MVNAKDAEIDALKKKIEEQNIMIQGLITALGSKEGRAKLEQIDTTKAFATYITELGEEAIKKQEEEYKKLIEENNNNNH